MCHYGSTALYSNSGQNNFSHSHFCGRADREQPAGRSQGHLPLIVDDIKLHSNCITTNTDKPFEIVSIHPRTEDNFSLSVGSTSNIIFFMFPTK